MCSIEKLILLLLVGVIACLATSLATQQSSHEGRPTIIIKPQPPGTGVSTAPPNTCPVPSEEMLRCVRQWACQYIIRLDLRCLLNLNGNPLLGNVLGGGTSPAVGGATGGGSGGLLGGILGL